MPDLLCKKCDVYVGFAAEGVVKRRPEGRDHGWLASHCWVCGRSREEIRRENEERERPPTPSIDRFMNTFGSEYEGPHGPVPPPKPPSTEVSTYVDKAMFDAEPERAMERPRVHLLSATPDPLGAVAAFSMMYEGRVVRDLAEITDEERRHYFDECFKTALKTPLEAIDLHFMVEGLTRASWDQMVRQRTAVFAGESLRFAVKPDLKESVRPGPLVNDKRNRRLWDDAIDTVSDAYHALIANGVPAEDARGLLPMNVLTRGHWKTNLRNLEAEVGKRLCTQAQFEWRLIHADLRRSIREYKPPRAVDRFGAITQDSGWQWRYIADPVQLHDQGRRAGPRRRYRGLGLAVAVHR
jgi:flavin-dependent thymidylate synthase